VSDGVLSPAEIAEFLDASRFAIIGEALALGARARDRIIPGEWCANEVLGHLIEADARAFLGRMLLMIDEEQPTFATWDQPAVAAARHDDERLTSELLAEFSEQREAGLKMIRRLTPTELARAGVHPVVGEVSVSDIAHEMVSHDRKHLEQMVGLTRRLVWPGMGNTRKFSDPSA